MEADTFGISKLPLLTIPHPVAVLNVEQIQALMSSKFELALDLIGSIERTDEYQPDPKVSHQRILVVEDNLEAIHELFIEHHWTDGLPIIPPTLDRVRDFIRQSKLSPDQVIGYIAPQNGLATVESVAVNSVMAGCKPEYLPVIIAALEAMLDPSFNLRGVQTTTHPCAPLIIVNGPTAKKLGLNGGPNAFGQGNQANASIGRAIRLILQNIGGALPGHRDRATQGQPSKYSYCIAENEELNPWEPLHVQLNYSPGESTVTVLAGENPHNINDHFSTHPDGLLATMADSICTMGMNNMYLGKSQVLLSLCPEHARIFADHGWTKQRISEYLFLHARKTIGKLKTGGMYSAREWPDFINEEHDEETVPLVQTPEDIHVIVVGGVGKHSSFVPSFGLTRTVTKPILSI